MTRVAPLLVSLLLLVAASQIGNKVAATDSSSAPGPPLLRRPVTVVVTDRHVVVGNRRSGTISLLDRSNLQAVAEYKVATRIAHMARVPHEPILLILDDAEQRLLRVSLVDGEPTVATIADVPTGGSRLVVAAHTRQVFLSTKWSRRIVALTLGESFEQVQQTRSIALPFAPQELLLTNGNRTLLVADAFGGQLAVVDTRQSTVLGTRKLAGHNIRGLAASSDQNHVLVAHQQIVPSARADYDELHWGRIVANAVQVFDIHHVLAPGHEDLAPGWLDMHGGIGSATADPASVITGDNGLVAVALAGVGEVAIRRGGYAKRLSVGRRPESMAVGDGRLFVANRFDDTLTVIDLKHGDVVETVSLGPVAELSAVDRGEQLFFDARLSHDGWLSCHSCHTDGHSSGLVVDTLGDGDYGAPKRTPSLLGTGDTAPWGWNGSSPSLAAQVRKSVATTMHGEPLADGQLSDLVAYLESLRAPPSAASENRSLIEQGQAVFESRGCADCHPGPTFTTEGTFNVGLADERKRRRFNPPSLRGVGQRDTYFHDGRSANLKDVLTRDRHQLDAELSPAETAALLSYLRSL